MDADFPELQDLLGPLVKLRVYTHICYCFPLPDISELPRIVQTLNNGYARLHHYLPWLTGQITIQPATSDRCKTPVVQRTDRLPAMIVNDLTVSGGNGSAFPSYETLRAANFPFHLLDGSQLNPQETKSITYDDQKPTTVFLVQLNVISGGILLTIAGEHSVMDGQGVAQITRMFSKTCANIPLTHQEIEESNRVRMDVIPQLDKMTYLSQPELSRFLITEEQKSRQSADPTTFMDLPNWTWTYIHFSASASLSIKTLANTTKTAETPYISTNDAISALLWQVVSRVRVLRLPTDTPSTFCRAVDMRPHLKLSDLYLGNMIHTAFSTSNLGDVSSLPLGQVASLLRAQLNSEELTRGLRAVATYVANHHDDLSGIHIGNGCDMSRDIWFSSWAKLPCYEFDFGLGLGRPEKVRVPRGGAFEGLLYLLPVDTEGGIDAAVCLRDSDLEILRADKEFGKWAEWIG